MTLLFGTAEMTWLHACSRTPNLKDKKLEN
jgi:hypothetical protein